MDIAQQTGHIQATTGKTAPTARQGSFSEGMCGTFVHENREGPLLPVRVVCGWPPGERQGGNPRMHGAGSQITS